MQIQNKCEQRTKKGGNIPPPKKTHSPTHRNRSGAFHGAQVIRANIKTVQPELRMEAGKNCFLMKLKTVQM